MAESKKILRWFKRSDRAHVYSLKQCALFFNGFLVFWMPTPWFLHIPTQETRGKNVRMQLKPLLEAEREDRESKWAHIVWNCGFIHNFYSVRGEKTQCKRWRLCKCNFLEWTIRTHSTKTQPAFNMLKIDQTRAEKKKVCLFEYIHTDKNHKSDMRHKHTDSRDKQCLHLKIKLNLLYFTNAFFFFLKLWKWDKRTRHNKVPQNKHSFFGLIFMSSLNTRRYCSCESVIVLAEINQ